MPAFSKSTKPAKGFFRSRSHGHCPIGSVCRFRKVLWLLASFFLRFLSETKAVKVFATKFADVFQDLQRVTRKSFLKRFYEAAQLKSSKPKLWKYKEPGRLTFYEARWPWVKKKTQTGTTGGWVYFFLLSIGFLDVFAYPVFLTHSHLG